MQHYASVRHPDFGTLVTQQRMTLPGFGISVTPMTKHHVVQLILSRPQTAVRLGNINLRGMRMWFENPEFKQYTDTADHVILDGWPLWFAAHTRERSLTTEYRVGSSDWLYELLALQPDLTIVAVGGTPDSARKAQIEAVRRAPQVTWHAFDGFTFTNQEPTSACTLQASLGAADLVLVGLGMPNQEKWILDNSALVPRGVIANVGGCLDYLAGVQAHTPRWLGRLGLEWLYRLIRAPRRLASRVFIDPIVVAKFLALSALRKRATKRQ